MGAEQREQWSLLHRVSFRFVFAYCVLYLPVVFVNAIPGMEGEFDPYTRLWDRTVLWVGDHVLQLKEPITVRPNGSGDTTWNYVQVFCFAVIAIAVTVIWSLIDFRRPSYPRLRRLLRFGIRYALAMTMIVYGSVKVIQSQFPLPRVERLLQPYGDSSPMGLLWTFMGASYGYNLFAGAGELAGGLLLTTRRTTLLGALINVGVMGHVAALNYCYDVPVKLLSTHLLVLDFVLIAPELGRLMNLLILNRPTLASTEQPLIQSPGLRLGILIVRTLLVASYLGWTLYDAHASQKKYGHLAPKSPLAGIWDVQHLKIDDADVALNDAKPRWQRALFEYERMFTVQLTNGQRMRFMVQELDEKAGTMKIQTSPTESTVWHYRRPAPDQLEIDGVQGGKKIEAKLCKSDRNFLLRSRGFHWINEYPFNR